MWFGKKRRGSYWLSKSSRDQATKCWCLLNRGQFYSLIYIRNCINWLGKKWRALIEYSQVIEINPQDTDAYLNRGTISSILR